MAGKIPPNVLLLFFQSDSITPAVAMTWVFFQPLLFGLIGAEVKVEHLKGNVIGKVQSR